MKSWKGGGEKECYMPQFWATYFIIFLQDYAVVFFFLGNRDFLIFEFVDLIFDFAERVSYIDIAASYFLENHVKYQFFAPFFTPFASKNRRDQMLSSFTLVLIRKLLIVFNLDVELRSAETIDYIYSIMCTKWKHFRN